ncbi:MFS transporter [Streptomyces sp. VRA16 Mangrove soil]|uniref:MFS transporter n=1 Tax=Streptomyces sp. VRA16 Mangrove soil TaxID=2817434 RepID=UPI001A9E66E6|nr:MFS transporter [Streptomyces sp. VRA16 Mangrove soil]MBO1337227.1 MFS transporter [Streptomyces sp. VRA16 Mangrove soil]
MDTSESTTGTDSEPAAAPEPRRGWRRFAMDTRPLRIPAYRRLWSSTIVTAVGSQLTAVAVPKQIYDITGSSAWVGAAGLAGLVPLIVFALWGGAVADSVDRRKLLLVTNSGIAVTSVLFWLQAVSGLDSVAVLMVLLAMQQAFWGLNAPARNASIARLVPESQLPAANALGSTVMQTGQVVGPLLAGVLIPVIGLPELYLIDALALCVTVWAVYRLPALPPLASAVKRRAGVREIAEGFRYISAHKVLLLSFLADIVAMVFGMPRALFPQLAAETYGSYGEGLALGLLFAAIPIGAVAGGLFSGTFSRAKRHGWMVIGAVVAWGAAIAGFGLSGSLWLGVFFLALAGVADMVSMVFRGAILLSAATDEMRGRMQGVFTVVVAGGPRLADVLHGSAGSAFGARQAVTGGGVLVVVVMLCLAFAVPALRRYRV